jgi:hypothetical protein
MVTFMCRARCRESDKMNYEKWDGLDDRLLISLYMVA